MPWRAARRPQRPKQSPRWPRWRDRVRRKTIAPLPVGRVIEASPKSARKVRVVPETKAIADGMRAFHAIEER